MRLYLRLHMWKMQKKFISVTNIQSQLEGAQFKCIQTLNLTWPCTEAEVKGAYRKLVKSAHPDGGGSQELFLALQEAYEQALQFCRMHSDETHSHQENMKNHR